jgi:hypothetical protein
VKVVRETAIPAGVYQIRLAHCPRFARKMPELLRVPGFVGIRIHWGNNENDTEGSILVGQKRTTTSIMESRLAYHALFNRMIEVDARHELIAIDIRDLR